MFAEVSISWTAIAEIRFDPLLVRRSEAVGQRHGAVWLPGRTGRVAVPVGRCHDFGHEPADLGEHLVDRCGVGVFEQLGRDDPVEIGDVVHHETDVAQRWCVLAHTERLPHGGQDMKLGLILSGRPLLCSARNTDRRGRRTVRDEHREGMT